MEKKKNLNDSLIEKEIGDIIELAEKTGIDMIIVAKIYAKGYKRAIEFAMSGNKYNEGEEKWK